jgi:hypothetical protein
MFKIEVKSTEIRTHNGVSAKGRPWTMREQEAWCHFPNHPYPLLIKFSLKEGAQPYPVGFYSIATSSCEVNRYGNLAFKSELDLIPATAASSSAPSSRAA